MSGLFVCSQGKRVAMGVWGAPSVGRCGSDGAALPRGDTRLHSLYLGLQEGSFPELCWSTVPRSEFQFAN